MSWRATWYEMSGHGVFATIRLDTRGLWVANAMRFADGRAAILEHATVDEAKAACESWFMSLDESSATCGAVNVDANGAPL